MSSSGGSFPDRKYIHDVFSHFSTPPHGVAKFFEYVDDDVDFEVTGSNRFSGRWYSKQSYYDATWAHIDALLAEPGYKLEVPGGGEECGGGIIVDTATGWSAVQLKTVGVKTRSGVPYNQHYSWHVRWSREGKIVEVKAFMDSDHLEKVLGGEMDRQSTK
ncbi:nuclear transport factor 2 family protein [Apiospora arundinis]|uniref:Nuclear transport factor 2 family protein n=1 Tax=Apiospora arundinis TaxID=335852 RepID=A0ABR2IWX0_9PEZI